MNYLLLVLASLEVRRVNILLTSLLALCFLSFYLFMPFSRLGKLYHVSSHILHVLGRKDCDISGNLSSPWQKMTCFGTVFFFNERASLKGRPSTGLQSMPSPHWQPGRAARDCALGMLFSESNSSHGSL